MSQLIATTCETCKDEMTVLVPDGAEIPEDEVTLCGPCRQDQLQAWQNEADMWEAVTEGQRQDEEMYGPNAA